MLRRAGPRSSLALEHEVDQVGTLRAQAGGELALELLHCPGASRFHAHAAGEGGPVEDRPVELHHVERPASGLASTDVRQLILEDRVGAVVEQDRGNVEALARLRP